MKREDKKKEASSPVEKSDRSLPAHWIWTSEKLPPRNQFVYFRKEFTLSGGPIAATLLITAERFYQLWVNGKWIGQGPALGHPSEKSYDVYEVSNTLQSGVNVVAAIVQFDGDIKSGVHTRWFVTPTCGGFWCQLEGRVNKSRLLITTDETWTAHPAQAFDSNASYLNDFYFQEIYTFGKDSLEWNKAAFSDDSWLPATVLGDTQGRGRDGQKLPWQKLVPRDIPPLKRERCFPVHVFSGEVTEHLLASDIGLQMTLEPVQHLTKARIEKEEALLSPEGGICTLRNSDPYESEDCFDGIHDATLILDFGHLRNAHLILELEGSANACLDIGYGPDLVDGRVCPYRSPRTSWADRLILKEGLQRWRSFFWRQFRFIQITLRKALGPVRLRGVYIESVSHAWQNTTSFHCSQAQLEAYWEASQRTAEACTMDIFTDTFAREGARQYTADPSHMVPATVALHQDEPIIRRYLRSIRLHQLPEGLFMDCCPGKASAQEISADAGFWHVQTIWEHYQRFGDRMLLAEHWESIRKHLVFWKGLANQRGLLDVEGTRSVSGVFAKWPCFDWVDLDRRGEMLILNAFYALNLRAAERIARLLGQEKKAKKYRQDADQVTQILRSQYWDDEQGFFVDTLVNGQRSQKFSEDSQGFMLYSELATQDQANCLVEMWQRSPELLAQAEIGFLYYILQGLVKYGHMPFAMILLHRLDRHLNRGRETFGETWSLRGSHVAGPWTTMSSRSVTHGCATWPAAFLLEHVVGLQTRWGAENCIRLAPQPVVRSAEANWCGNEIHWEQDAKHWRLTAHLVKPTPIKLVLPFLPEKVESLHLNGIAKPVQSELCLGDCTEIDVDLTLRVG